MMTKSRSEEADLYLLSILERPGMYAGPSVWTLECVLLNLLNFRCLVYGVACDPREILRKAYLERYGESAGAAGPSSKLISQYGDDSSHEEVRAFYKKFVDAVISRFSPYHAIALVPFVTDFDKKSFPAGTTVTVLEALPLDSAEPSAFIIEVPIFDDNPVDGYRWDTAELQKDDLKAVENNVSSD